MNYLDWLYYIMPPVVGGLIGYFTNCLAIGMLFRPHREKRIAGIRLPFTPGVFPKERERLAKKISETVSDYVLTPDMLAKELASGGLWQGLRALTVEELLKQLGVDPQNSEQWLTKGLNALRGYWFAEGVTVGERVPTALTDALKKSAAALLPKAVDYARQWPEENPWLDEKLSAMVRKIIDENFGRLIGMFIDHQKIYQHIKDGLFEYLSDAENQQFMAEQISRAIDRLRSTEFSDFEQHLPENQYFIDKITAWMQSDVMAVPADDTVSLNLYQRISALTLGELAAYLQNGKEMPYTTDARIWRVLEKAAAYVAKQLRIQAMIEDKLNAFSVAEMEALILSVVRRELRIIMSLGGLLGFLIGLLSLLPQWLSAA